MRTTGGPQIKGYATPAGRRRSPQNGSDADSGTPTTIYDFDEEIWRSQLIAGLTRVLASELPRHVTQRGNPRQRTFLSSECSDTNSEALRRHKLTGRPLGDDDFDMKPVSSRVGMMMRKTRPERPDELPSKLSMVSAELRMFPKEVLWKTLSYSTTAHPRSVIFFLSCSIDPVPGG